jgi:hypothetical protein
MAHAATMYDKYAVVQKLQKRGFTHEQAEGIAEVLTNSDVSQLVTKSDLEIALANQTISLIKWMTGMLLAQGALVVALIELLQ